MTPADIQSLCGWISDPKERDRIAAMQPFPTFGDAAPHLKDSGAGKDVFLWQIEEAITGQDCRLPNYQKTGDCVSMGTSQGAEDLQYIQISDQRAAGQPEGHFKKVATEVVYAGGRHEIGKDGCGRSAGMVVGWAIEWAKQFGLLPRGVYGDIDLSEYDVAKADGWGRPRYGCPDALEPLAKQFPLVTCSLIESNYYENARDAIANKCLIVTGSNQLFSQSRDKNGFITRHGKGGHCTYYRGFTDNGTRPGIFYQNSWSKDYHVGPQLIDIPGRSQQVKIPYGGGFISPEDFNAMHRGQEVWVISKLTSYDVDPAPAAIYQIKLY